MHDFIRTCLRTKRMRPFRGFDDPADPRIDWLAAIADVNEDWAAPALWTALTETGLADRAPKDVRDYLAFLHAENARSNGELRGQCLAIGKVLAESGFEAVLLKGAAWLFEDGPARADRMMRDIDILLRARDIGAARDALVSSGYRVAEAILAEPGYVHELPLIRDGDPASVELHVEVSTRLDMLPAAEIWAEAVPVAAGLRAPSPRHRIVHNVIHAQITNGDYAGGVVSLRDSLDLARLANGSREAIDWSAMAALARDRNYSGPLSGALHKAARFAGGFLPPPFSGDSGGRRHALRCAMQRVLPALDRPLRKLGILRRALAWERDSYALKLGSDRGPGAHLKVNRRRLDRARRALTGTPRKD